MRFFGTDFGLKYIIVEVDEKEITVSFRDSFRKGVYDVSFRINGCEYPARVKSAYPGFIQRIQEVAFLARLTLKYAVNRISKRNG